MADATTELIKTLLQEATRKAEALQAKLEAGEEVSEEEMSVVAKGVAEAIEEANARLRAMIGPIDTALLREKIVENMTSEEFDKWSEENAEINAHRARKEAQDG